MKNVCVFCGASFGADKKYLDSVTKAAKAMIENNLGLVYGGGKVGLMGEIADFMLANGGKVVGVIPEFMVEKGLAHKSLTELITVKSMHERKYIMQEKADAFIALPGGLGTLEEIFEAITWGQLSLHKKPCAFYNIHGYYDLVTVFLDHAAKEGFIDKESRGMIVIEDDINSILNDFFDYVHPAFDKAAKALDEHYAAKNANNPDYG